MADMATTGKESSFMKQMLIINTMEKMNEDKAGGDRGKYFIRWKFATQLCMPHMTLPQRSRLQKEFNQLTQIEKEIEGIPENEMNISTKNEEILKLRYAFADGREFFIMETLPKLGLGQDFGEGVMDFTKWDIDSVAKTVQDVQRGPLKAADKNIVPAVAEPDETPAPIELESDDETASQLE